MVVDLMLLSFKYPGQTAQNWSGQGSNLQNLQNENIISPLFPLYKMRPQEREKYSGRERERKERDKEREKRKERERGELLSRRK